MCLFFLCDQCLRGTVVRNVFWERKSSIYNLNTDFLRFQEAKHPHFCTFSHFDLFSINKTPPIIHKQHHHRHRHQVSTSCLKQQFLSVEQVGEFPPRLKSGADANTTYTVQALTRQREVDSVCVYVR